MALAKVLRPYVEAYGLTMFQLRVLVSLKHEELSLTELVDRTQSHKGYVSSVVDELAECGFVIRERSEHNRRSIVIKATQAGTDTLHKIVGPGTEFNHRLQDAFTMSPDEMNYLINLHRRVTNNLVTGGTENT